jgi:5-methylcytosine-specific restriction endonuclease McrA
MKDEVTGSIPVVGSNLQTYMTAIKQQEHSKGITRLRTLIKKKESDLSDTEREEKKNLIRQHRFKDQSPWSGNYTEDWKWLLSVLRVEARRAVIRNGTFTKEEWSAILELQRNRCKYCRKPFTADCSPTIDHVRPLKPVLSSYGRRGAGRHEAKNIVASCRKCNSKKNNRVATRRH